MSDLAKNLELLSSRFKSVSELCRQLNINRSQFARYISGESEPSAYNLRRIVNHFGISHSDIALRHKEFAARFGDDHKQTASASFSSINPLRGTSLGNIEEMKTYTGYYFTHLQSPTYPTGLLKSLVHLHFDGTNVLSTMDEKFIRMSDGSRQVSRYEGVVSLLNGCLFIVDIEATGLDTILEIILKLPHRRKSDILVGMIMGMTTGIQRLPYASITAWQFLGKRINQESKLKQCGFHDMNAESIDPRIREAFSLQDVSFVYPKFFDRP